MVCFVLDKMSDSFTSKNNITGKESPAVNWGDGQFPVTETPFNLMKSICSTLFEIIFQIFYFIVVTQF